MTVLTFSRYDDNEIVNPPADSITHVTDINYGLAETQVIFNDYKAKIATATGTNEVGVIMHNRQAPNPRTRPLSD